MNTLVRPFLMVMSTLLLLSGCNVVRPCTQSFCGCWKNTTYRYETVFKNSTGNLLGGVELYCPDTDQSFGVSNTQGLIDISFKTQESPGCGISTCRHLSVKMDGRTVGSIDLQHTNSHSGELVLSKVSEGYYGHRPNDS